MVREDEYPGGGPLKKKNNVLPVQKTSLITVKIHEAPKLKKLDLLPVRVEVQPRSAVNTHRENKESNTEQTTVKGTVPKACENVCKDKLQNEIHEFESSVRRDRLKSQNHFSKIPSEYHVHKSMFQKKKVKGTKTFTPKKQAKVIRNPQIINEEKFDLYEFAEKWAGMFALCFGVLYMLNGLGFGVFGTITFLMFMFYAYTRFKTSFDSIFEKISIFFSGVQDSFSKAFLYSLSPNVLKTQSQINNERKLFAQQDEHANKGVIIRGPPADGEVQRQYNFKVQVRINDDSFIIAELDSDSHISLITEEYFNHLLSISEVEYLSEEPVTFNGLNSVIKSKYPPVLLRVQIGRIVMTHRFVVTNTLNSSPILLGTDLMVRHEIYPAKYEDGKWYVNAGSVEEPVSKVPAFLTNKIFLKNKKDQTFAPFEIKKISVTSNVSGYEKELFESYGIHKEFLINPSVAEFSPFQVVDDQLLGKGCLLIENRYPETSIMPQGMEIAAGNLNLTVFKVQNPKKIIPIIRYDENEIVLNTEELEKYLEPGICSPAKIDKDLELDHVRNHSRIPEELKPELIEFLESRANLFSGEEFSAEHFPREIYEHDVELIDESVSSLTSRPFPCSGIRLSQLKTDIDSLVRNGVLSPGDSAFTSPVFYVLKKAGDGKTAAKGRLCFDYRKINGLIKNKNFPLITCKNFFDKAGQYKYFCVLDIQNAFLSLPLTEKARQYLAIITPFGTYLPNRTPFGLKTSPSAFCFALSKILGDLDFTNYFMDDIHIGGRTEKEMVENLKTVMDRLFQHNLKIRLSKTKFFESKCKLLGMVFSNVGREVDPEKVRAIKDFGELDSIKKVQSFLGMCCYLSSFIPHFSTACSPLYGLLRDQKTKPFMITKEATAAYESLKQYIGNTCLLYHPDLHRPLYLSCDASNVGAGAFLYQVRAYPKNESGKNMMLNDLGYIIDEKESEKYTPYMLPGVAPGKNTPVVTNFVLDSESVKKYDELNTLDENMNMTEKIARIQENYVLHVRPVSFYSKSFTPSQCRGYPTMEKEFLSLMLAITNFRDYLMSVPITYVLTDSQPVCWALRHKEENLKLSRWILRLYEYQINFVVTHLHGTKNVVADWLSRLYYVPEIKSKTKDNFDSKQGCHITPPFSPFSVLTKEDVLENFNPSCVIQCQIPDLCHLNVNRFLFPNKNIDQEKIECKPKSLKIEKENISLSFAPDSLEKHLTRENIILKQREDTILSKIIEALEEDQKVGNYLLKNGLLKKSFKNRRNGVVIPKELVPFLIAKHHFQSHSGAKKLLSTIQLSYYWKNMTEDINAFCRGCVLCSIFKSSSTGQNEIGTPRLVLEPAKYFQMDIVSGLVSVKGYKSFLNVIDLYTGFSIPIALKHETSEEIAKILDERIFRIFGPPTEISSDNAANLAGPELRKLFSFYGVKHRQTVPYSPTSHSLVEISNRYITQLLRIFSDQFKSHWIDVLSLAALMYNSVPRVQLNNHSPSYLMFLREPFLGYSPPIENFNLENYLKKSLNDRNYVKLVRELLLKIREKRNKAIKRRLLSFPVGSLILVKDLRPKAQKKLKPIFYKVPQKVINEYRCTVYSEDFLGKIFKHSKNNIRTAHKRSAFLFSKLPDNIKVVLGDEFDEDIWDKIKNTKYLPDYLNDINIDENLDRQLRSDVNLPKDTHLLEQGKELNTTDTNQDNRDEDNDEDEEFFENLISNQSLNILNVLHDNELLNAENIRLQDITSILKKNPALEMDINNEMQPSYETNLNNLEEIVDDFPESNLIQEPNLRENMPKRSNLDPAALNEENILPFRTRGSKPRVRFNLPN